MLEGINGLLIYLSLKLGGYTLWSYVGLRWLEPKHPNVLSAAIARGAGRLVLGWVTGILVAPFALAAFGTNHVAMFYFTALALVRWFEWGVIQYSISTPQSGLRMFLDGGSSQGRLWRFSGILVSYVADAPFLIAEGGFPQGR